LKVVLASTSLLALPTYKAIKSSENEFLALITKHEERSGRGKKIVENELATALGNENVVRVKGNEDLASALKRLRPDVAIAISFGLLIKPESLAIPIHGWINLHFSLLPKFRGAAPVARAILAGEKLSGITVFKLDSGMDTGPIYATKEMTCGSGTNGELLERFAEAGSEEVLKALEMIENGISPVPQTGPSSLAPKIDNAETRLRLDQGVDEVLNCVRAFSPKPGAWCEFNGARIKILEAHLSDLTGDTFGEILSISPLVIALGDGALEIIKIQEAGKRLMSADEWTRGARVRIGDRFA